MNKEQMNNDFVWQHLNRPELGILNSISKLIQAEEWLRHDLLTSVRSGEDLLIASDYGGEHKISAYQSLSFIVVDLKFLWRWNEERTELRKRILKDSRRVSFKKLTENRRREHLTHFLRVSNSIPGLLASFLIDKRIDSIFVETPESQEIGSLIINKTKWAPKSYEKLLRIGHFGSLLISGLSAPGQNLLWVTDQDEIVSNVEKHTEATNVFGHCMDQTLRHNMGHFRLASTKSDNGSRDLEDLASIPDLAAGALAEFSTTLENEGGFLDSSIMRPLSKKLSFKSRAILAWLAESHHTLKRLSIVVQSVSPTGIRARLLRMKIDNSNLNFN
jgi:hypothetical protein